MGGAALPSADQVLTEDKLLRLAGLRGPNARAVCACCTWGISAWARQAMQEGNGLCPLHG